MNAWDRTDSSGERPALTLPSAGAMLRAKAHQGTNRTIAATLAILEDIADDHAAAMAKLRAALPEAQRPLVDLADWFNESRFDTLRTRILKTANDGRRDMEDTIAGLRLD